MTRLPDPAERFTDLLKCGCELSAGSWSYCAAHRDRYDRGLLTDGQPDPLDWTADADPGDEDDHTCPVCLHFAPEYHERARRYLHDGCWWEHRYGE